MRMFASLRSLCRNLFVAVNNILHNRKCLVFRDSFALLEVGAEVALGAKLSDDVAVGCLSDDLIAPEDVGVF